MSLDLELETMSGGGRLPSVSLDPDTGSTRRALVRTGCPVQLIGVGFIAIGVGLLASWVADGPVQFGVAAAAFGSGYGLIFPSVDASINAIAPSSYRAGALSLRNSATFLGLGTGPLAFALAAAVLGYRPVLAISGGAILVAGVGTLIVTRGDAVTR